MSVSNKKIVREVATDPGVGWAVVDSLLFYGVNPLGFIACASATLLSASIKALSLKNPKFLQKFPTIERVVHDSRTPLRIGGLGNLVVAGAGLATGAVLSATCGAFFALGCFMVAESITREQREAKQKQDGTVPPEKNESLLRKTIRLGLTRPDLYLAAGFVCAGLLAGGATLWAMPIVATAFAFGLKNIVKQQPEHKHHPKLFYTLAAGVFCAVGAANGLVLPAIAHALNGAIFLKVEGSITPGGFGQVARDLARGMLSPFRRKKDAPAPDAAPQPAVEGAPALASRSLTKDFSATVAPDAACAPTGEIPLNAVKHLAP